MSDPSVFSPPPPEPPPAQPPHAPFEPPRPVFPSAMPPAQPERGGRGCGFWAGWLLAFCFLMTSGLLLLAVFGLSVGKVVDESPQRTMIEKTLSGKGDKKVLVVPIRGLISDRPREQSTFRVLPGLVTAVRQRLEQARRDRSIKAVIVRVDSPGGGITASDIIHEEIKRYRKKTKNKIIVSMGDVAASGGYYVSAPADKIVAHPTTITGSFGVIMLHANIEGLLQNLGITTSPIKSGPMKDMGSWTREMTVQERKLLQDMINEMQDRFVKVIAEGRTAAGVKMSKEDVRKVADGRIYTALQAKDLRLVDQIGYFDDAVALAKKEAKLTEAKVVQYYYPAFSFFDLFSAEAAKRPVVSLDIESLTIPYPPKLMYLWTGGRVSP